MSQKRKEEDLRNDNASDERTEHLKKMAKEIWELRNAQLQEEKVKLEKLGYEIYDHKNSSLWFDNIVLGIPLSNEIKEKELQMDIFFREGKK